MRKLFVILCTVAMVAFNVGCGQDELKNQPNLTVDNVLTLEEYSRLTPIQDNITVRRSGGGIIATFDYNKEKYVFIGLQQRLQHADIAALTHAWQRVAVYCNKGVYHIIPAGTTFDNFKNKYKRIYVVDANNKTLQAFYNLPVQPNITTNEDRFARKKSRLQTNISVELEGLDISNVQK